MCGRSPWQLLSTNHGAAVASANAPNKDIRGGVKPTGEERTLASARLRLHRMTARKIGAQLRFKFPANHRHITAVIRTAVIGESNSAFQTLFATLRVFSR
jgi:hypothetical protein